MRAFLKFAGLGIALSVGHAHASTILYSDDFEGPYGDYWTVYGATQVVGPTGPFATRSLAFNNAVTTSTSLQYDQIQYGSVEQFRGPEPLCDYFELPDCPRWQKSYTLEFDLATSGLVGAVNNFAVFFDVPDVRRVDFTNTGEVRVSIPGSGSGGTIGHFTDGQALHVSMLFDLHNNLWDISLDGLPVYHAAIYGGELRNIRFSHGPGRSGVFDSGATTYLDNVVISQVPVPATGWLFGSALLWLVKRLRSGDRN